jgi:hypothetical protein
VSDEGHITMKIGGHGEFWMVIGPVVAVGLVATYLAGGPQDAIILAERAANEVWTMAVTALRR